MSGQAPRTIDWVTTPPPGAPDEAQFSTLETAITSRQIWDKIDRMNEGLWALRKDTQERNAAFAAERAERDRWVTRFLWVTGLYITTVIALAIYIATVLR